MLVNHDFKMAFMHAPKCAGIALSHWLVEHYGFTYYLNPDELCPIGGVVERHRYALPEECRNYEIITCVREPLERWESFYLYQTLQMGVDLSFDDFTRERITWLPLQSEYTRHADYILRVDHLKNDVCKLPFVRYPIPALPRLNVSRDQQRYEQAKRQINWTIGLRSLVADHFKGDFDYEASIRINL